MKTSGWIIALWLLVFVAQADASIAAGPFTNNASGRRYLLLNPGNWPSLEAEAVSLGGHLATVRDAAEQAWLVSTFGPLIGNQPAFIGLTDRDVEGTWVWVSGDGSTYRNFYPGEPNGGSAENYAELTSATHVYTGRWNDNNGTAVRHGIAELPPPRNALVNGDFELGNTGFSSDYAYVYGTPDAAMFELARNPMQTHGFAASFGDHTSGNGLMLLANGGSNTNQAIWRQAVNVRSNTTYEFMAWVTSFALDFGGNPHDVNPPRVKMMINGTQAGNSFQTSGDSGRWEQLRLLWNSQSLTSVIVELRLESTASSGNDLALDDLSLKEFAPRMSVQVADVDVCWTSDTNRTYQVEYRSVLTTNMWTPLGSAIPGNGGTNCITDSVRVDAKRFYRVRQLP